MGYNTFQVLDVIFTVERAHFIDTCSVWLVYIEFLVQSVAEHKLVRHLHPERLHGVTRAVVNAAHRRVVKVRHFLRGHLSTLFSFKYLVIHIK